MVDVRFHEDTDRFSVVLIDRDSYKSPVFITASLNRSELKEIIESAELLANMLMDGVRSLKLTIAKDGL